MSLSETLRSLREAAGLDVDAAAVAAGLSPHRLLDLEGGLVANPFYSEVAALAHAYRTSVAAVERAASAGSPQTPGADAPTAGGRARGRPARTPAAAEQAPSLTTAAARRGSLDPLDEVDRLTANRAVARTVARMLFDHEQQRAAGRLRPPSAAESGRDTS